MTALRKVTAAVAASASIAGAASETFAAGMSRPWQMGLQDAASPVMGEIQSFHTILLVIITVIALFVLGLLLVCILRFNAKANPTPSKTSHNSVLEVLWTALPVLILVVIAVPSFKLLYFADRTAEAEMTIKAIGNQWYWSYEYPDHDELAFDATMLEDDERAEGQPRLLATDNMVVVPAETNIRLLVTASDVIHSWAMPAFGVKLDGVPGRTNETWFRIDKPGVYYGQCSELCGIRHGFMPIAVKAVTKDEFEAWLVKAKVEFAQKNGDEPVKLAAELATERR